jgi:hypothetical protein
MTKIEGSGAISQRHGSADPDPDPPQNVLDPQHCLTRFSFFYIKFCLQVSYKIKGFAISGLARPTNFRICNMRLMVKKEKI